MTTSCTIKSATMGKAFPTHTGLALDCWQCRSGQTNWEEAALSHEEIPAAPRSRSVYHLTWQRKLPPPLLQMWHKSNPANFSLNTQNNGEHPCRDAIHRVLLFAPIQVGGRDESRPYNMPNHFLNVHKRTHIGTKPGHSLMTTGYPLFYT